MGVIENPHIMAVKKFEGAINTAEPSNHKLIYDWVSSLILESPKPKIGSLYQGNPSYIIDRVRVFPYIHKADYFFKSGIRNNLFDGTLSQYQTDGHWNHEEQTLEHLKTVIDRNGSNIQSLVNLAIEMFGKSGNVRGLTNLFHYAEEHNLSIPPHIQLEALFWAEVGSAKNLLEQENHSELKNIIRVSGVRRRDEGQKFVERDPVLHLFRAYRLAEMMEAILTEQI